MLSSLALRKALKETATVDQAAPVVRSLVAEVMPSALTFLDGEIHRCRALDPPEKGLGDLSQSLLSLENEAGVGGAGNWLNELRYALSRATGLHGDCSPHDPCVIDGRAAHCRYALAHALRREAKRQEWAALEVCNEGADGLRHYLEGRDVHCGAALELQAVERRYDAHEEAYTFPLQRGALVRYEASFGTEIEVRLYADVAGRTFGGGFETSMRFRWPPRDV